MKYERLRARLLGSAFVSLFFVLALESSTFSQTINKDELTSSEKLVIDGIIKGPTTDGYRDLRSGLRGSFWRKPADVNFRLKYGKTEITPLHYAVIRGEYSIVRLLVQKGADIHARDSFGQLPLHFALASPHSYSKDIVKFLLGRGTFREAYDAHGFNPLHYAIRAELVDAVQLLLRYRGSRGNKIPSDPNAPILFFSAQHHSTPLLLAVASGNADIVELLLQNGANPRTSEGSTWFTALHMVSTRAKGSTAHTENYLRIARLLLSFGADPNARNAQNKTPLDYAIENSERWNHSVFEELQQIYRTNKGLTSKELNSCVSLVRSFWREGRASSVSASRVFD